MKDYNKIADLIETLIDNVDFSVDNEVLLEHIQDLRKKSDIFEYAIESINVEISEFLPRFIQFKCFYIDENQEQYEDIMEELKKIPRDIKIKVFLQIGYLSVTS